MAQEVVTFEDIQDSVLENLGIQSSDTNARNKVKRLINKIYKNEVVPFKPWWWLKATTQVVHAAYYATGTADVTPDSTTVTLSTAPTGLNFTGYRFSVNGSDQVYTVASHSTSSTTVTLSTAFQEDNDNTAEYKIWRDRFDLPVGAKETTEIWHIEQSEPLDAIGSQELREYEAYSPKEEGFPYCYTTADYYDPTSGTDEFESDRYRQTLIYPSINSEKVILNVDYIQEVDALDDDADEPLLPIGDRGVLVDGATALAAQNINRNQELHDSYWFKYQQKLARMAGEREEGQDTPKLAPKKNYINSIRRSGLRR